MGMLIRLALSTNRPLAEVMEWEPEHVATAVLWLKEQADAAKGQGR